MSEKETANLDELYQDPIETETKDKKKKADDATSVTIKRKPDLKTFTASKKPKRDEPEGKTEEEIKKEEEEKKEYILKIQNAFQDDLMGTHEEILAMKKEIKLQTMSLEDLKKAWSRIMAVNGNDHPRHIIYQSAIAMAKRAEIILERYPNFSCPGFSNRLEQNPLFRQKLHMWALDRFNHAQISYELSILYQMMNEYQISRAYGQKKQEQQEIWSNLKVNDEILDRFSDL